MGRIWNALKSVRAWWRDGELNRRLVGKDVYGNSYYQYYTSEGLPDRRIAEYVKGWRNAQTDPLWVRWLNGTERLPPTSDDVMKSKEDYDRRRRTGAEFDQQEEERMRKWREAYSKTRRATGEAFKPESWDPSKPPRS